MRKRLLSFWLCVAIASQPVFALEDATNIRLSKAFTIVTTVFSLAFALRVELGESGKDVRCPANTVPSCCKVNYSNRAVIPKDCVLAELPDDKCEAIGGFTELLCVDPFLARVEEARVENIPENPVAIAGLVLGVVSLLAGLLEFRAIRQIPDV